jgi:uncharacterized repeat protein (TIGR03803 family)
MWRRTKMKTTKLVLSRIAHCKQLKSFCISAALIFTTLMLVAATTTVATAQTYTDLYNFGTNSGDPLQPSNSLLAQGRDGNLYSTSLYGGTSDLGTVFKITPGGTITVLYEFDRTHGSYPYTGLTLGTDGNFYGTTFEGGAHNYGTIFRITPSGSLTTLHSFTNDADGNSPWAPPMQGADGNFYGTTCGCPGLIGHIGGTAYKITPSGKLTTLYQFAHDPVRDGVNPLNPLVLAIDGSFYGTTDNQGAYNQGTIFKITAYGKLTTIYNFDNTHGNRTYGQLVQTDDGKFYAPTTGGGKSNDGVVYKISPDGKYIVLHNFGGSDGAVGWAGLVLATDGNFYGTTEAGGTTNDGTIYRISPDRTFSVLYNFDGTTGSQSYATLLQHTSGILYGVTYAGGAYNDGVFYSFDVGLGPFVRLVSTVGKAGDTAGILGQGFTGTTNVSFDGISASFTVVSDTYVEATVPSAPTTGPLTVTTPGGTLTSNQSFRVKPVILSFSPTSGPVGTPVTITGSSLTQTTKVAFGGVKATSFTVNSDTQVTATVPTGAQTGHIAITTTGDWTWSPGIFTVTQ